jgi:predicted Zn-dependent protease
VSGETGGQSGSLAAALENAARLLPVRADRAAEQAREILRVVPNHSEASLILGAALRGMGDTAGALAALEPLARSHPKAANVQYEYGMALLEAERGEEAIAALRRAVRANGKHARAWRGLGDAYTVAGDSAGADEAYGRHIEASINDPRLMEAAAALCENKLAVAEHLLRPFLKENPTDVPAIRMLAEVAARLRRFEDCENLLARALELAPGFDAARYQYAMVLSRQNKAVEALAELDRLIAREPRNPAYLTMQAACLARIGEYQQTIESYEFVLKTHPTQAKMWMSYGHALKTVGRTEDGIAAYRRSIELLPSLGESWWSLANLKTFRFSDADIAAVRETLERGDLSDEDRLHLEFTLGKALEDRGDYASSFAHYDKANALRRPMLRYSAEETTAFVERAMAFFTTEYFAERKGWGAQDRDPIFILGLTRAGSTLLEQILSSHSAVEGTMELPDIPALARKIAGKPKKDPKEAREGAYPEVLATMGPEALEALGAEYIQRTRIQRKSRKPFFVDKMPNNWMHLGFIHSILPNAKIIDARRHPLGCCFSNFKQHFARGQGFTYSLKDVGLYYRDYVQFMAHMDRALPGVVHRVFYEDMVADPEREVRRLLAYCGLDFEPGCLRFYENERAVRTASSEQVRQPIYTEGRDRWQNFEPFLVELKAALGPVLENYPLVPEM